MVSAEYDNQQLSQPVPVKGVHTAPSLFASQQAFTLTHAEYLHLTGRPAITETWAMNTFFAAIGYALSVGPKVVDWIRDGKNGPTQTEWWLIAAGFIVSVVLYLIGRMWPNEKRALLTRMKNHFNNAQVTYHMNGESR